MGNIVHLSLGSNVGDRRANLREAIARLEKLGKILAISSPYETEPVDVVEQEWFLNCALEIESEKTPIELLAGILAIERQMGRHRSSAKGPRNIDIDIVLFGDLVIHSQSLNIPHPQMHSRRFVLDPLAEIAPQARHPLLQKTVAEMRADLMPGKISRRTDWEDPSPTLSKRKLIR